MLLYIWGWWDGDAEWLDHLVRLREHSEHLDSGHAAQNIWRRYRSENIVWMFGTNLLASYTKSDSEIFCQSLSEKVGTLEPDSCIFWVGKSGKILKIQVFADKMLKRNPARCCKKLRKNVKKNTGKDQKIWIFLENSENMVTTNKMILTYFKLTNSSTFWKIHQIVRFLYNWIFHKILFG